MVDLRRRIPMERPPCQFMKGKPALENFMVSDEVKMNFTNVVTFVGTCIILKADLLGRL